VPNCPDLDDSGYYSDEIDCPDPSLTTTTTPVPPLSEGRHAGITIAFTIFFVPCQISIFFCVRNRGIRVISWVFLVLSIVDGVGLIAVFFTKDVAQVRTVWGNQTCRKSTRSSTGQSIVGHGVAAKEAKNMRNVTNPTLHTVL
jgi:hypothetical protein